MTNCSEKNKTSCKSDDSCEFDNGTCKTKSASMSDYLIFSFIILVVVFLLWLLYKALTGDKSPSENQWKLLGQDW
mgnify:CR=1 FL=1